MTRSRALSFLLTVPLLATPLAAQTSTMVDSAQAAVLLRDSNFVAAARAYAALTAREPSNPNHWSRLGQAEPLAWLQRACAARRLPRPW